jgi:hypothetical protein
MQRWRVVIGRRLDEDAYQLGRGTDEIERLRRLLEYRFDGRLDGCELPEVIHISIVLTCNLLLWRFGVPELLDSRDLSTAGLTNDSGILTVMLVSRLE